MTLEKLDFSNILYDMEKEKNEDREKYLEVLPHYFVLKDPNYKGFEYDIEKERITNRGDIIWWIMHLTEKYWITTRHVRLIIIEFSRYLNIDPRTGEKLVEK